MDDLNVFCAGANAADEPTDTKRARTESFIVCFLISTFLCLTSMMNCECDVHEVFRQIIIRRVIRLDTENDDYYHRE